ncbi:MAG: PUR family DNA/RNA-binding protein [Verrucomicrobiales bacterium]
MLNYQDEPRMHAPPLATEKVFTERKTFFLDLKENARGRFVKVTEDVRGRRDTIMLPVEALDEFLQALTNLAEYEKTLD